MVNKGRSWVSITSDGHTLVHAVGGLSNDVVQLVTHTARLGDVTDGTGAVELGRNNVVHHTTSVTDLEATRLDSTNSGGANDGDALLLRNVQDLACTALGDTLGNDGNALDLRLLHQLQGAAIHGP